MVMDPVCGMEVDKTNAAATFEYKGKMYYFCSPGCKAAFEQDPENYLQGNGEHGGHGHPPHSHHD